ncbi:MucB/RseB C-terminal domain-containing protein [Thiofilum flexile]|uniref:MucB/RseB C-terminal domain-containing protein n=1 Tax=Thiofilum flexile TaxID=125627 RepID=UPI0013A59324|nr:MucB/RseB C-terminal domain-containing protein [Thiofilum flexile]
MNRVSLLATLGLCLGVSTAPLLAADSALELLELMQSSARQLNYQGKLVYQQDNNLSTFRVTHSSQGGEESVVYLDPKTGRDSKDSPVETKSFSLSTYNKLQPQTQKAYSFDLGAKEWVANIECQVVVARPKDAMRYLHRYCIDPQTGMLLKYSLIDRSKEVVEQLMFTEIKLDTDEAEAESSAAATSAAKMTDSMVLAAVPSASASTETTPAETNIKTNNWGFTKLPLGFEKIAEIQQSTTHTQIIVSDGMTSVSIFVDAKGQGEDLVTPSRYTSGAMNILTSEVGDYMITLMGEVPESTLEIILKGLKYLPKS